MNFGGTCTIRSRLFCLPTTIFMGVKTGRSYKGKSLGLHNLICTQHSSNRMAQHIATVVRSVPPSLSPCGDTPCWIFRSLLRILYTKCRNKDLWELCPSILPRASSSKSLKRLQCNLVLSCYASSYAEDLSENCHVGTERRVNEKLYLTDRNQNKVTY